MDGPSAQGFLSLTGPLAPRVEDCRSAAMLIKSALRDGLAVSYGMISILQIGSLRSPPPIRLRRTSPCSGGRINRSMPFCKDMAPWLSIHSPTTKWGEGGGASHQRGIAGVVHEVYDSLFFSSNSLFPLEGKCHVVAKGCTGQRNDVILYRYPDRQSAASLATSWSSPPLQAGGTRFNKCSCKGFCIRGRLL